MRLLGLITAISASLLVACGEAPTRSVDDVRRVAVVPVAGETMQLARVGRLPFANRRSQLDVSDWDLRDETYRAVKDVLERGGRYVVSRVDASPDAFPALHAAAGQGACRDRNARRELSRLASLCGCDALLLIIDDRRQLDPDGAQYFQGYSWVGQAGVAGSNVSASQAVVALRAVLVDARTQKVIAERRNDEPGGYPGVPRGPVDARWWPADMATVGHAERERLEPVFVALTQDTVRRAVQGTGLLAR
jgi:CBS domain-containing protein